MSPNLYKFIAHLSNFVLFCVCGFYYCLLFINIIGKIENWNVQNEITFFEYYKSTTGFFLNHRDTIFNLNFQSTLSLFLSIFLLWSRDVPLLAFFLPQSFVNIWRMCTNNYITQVLDRSGEHGGGEVWRGEKSEFGAGISEKR